MNSSDTLPWYKQFWPWFLISVPLISIILSFTMLRLATNTTDSLVIDDYYKEGRGINLELTKVQEAIARNIEAQLKIEQSEIRLDFLSGAPQSGTALQLQFQHTTQIEKDFSVMLTRDAQGTYRASVDHNIDGKWRLTLLPIDKVWKVMDTIVLPNTSAIDLKPH